MLRETHAERQVVLAISGAESAAVNADDRGQWGRACKGANHIQSKALSFAAGDRIFQVRLPDHVLRNGKSGGRLGKETGAQNHPKKTCCDTTNHFFALLTRLQNCDSVS